MRTVGPYVAMRRRYLELLLEPWYHDFTPLGVTTAQRQGRFPSNQDAKSEVLLPYIDRALDRVRSTRRNVPVLELFCADAFYGHYALQRGADRLVGVEREPAEAKKAELIGQLLGHRRRMRFVVGDVRQFDGTYSIGICAGGLYHLEDPARLLRRLHDRITDCVVVQTVYHAGIDDPEYFESPAPGWTWGCRFSLPYLHQMVTSAGWRIADHDTNVLVGNDRPEDRGSAYLLLEHA